MDKPLHFRAARVHISPPRGLKDKENNIVTPVVDVLLVTENGEIWKRTLMAFGATKDFVFSEWNTNPERFIKVDQPFGK